MGIQEKGLTSDGSDPYLITTALKKQEGNRVSFTSLMSENHLKPICCRKDILFTHKRVIWNNSTVLISPFN